MPKFSEIDNKTPEQLIMIQEYIDKPFGFFLIAGTNGTGKSFVSEVIYETISPYQLPFYDRDIAWLINQFDLNELWFECKGETKHLSYTLKNSKLLVLDDIGTREPTSAFLDFFYGIIDYRWKNREKLGTIITTNMNAETMRLKFSDAIVSRIASGKVTRFDGPDRRFKQF